MVNIHEKITDLLPYYLNGTLSEEEMMLIKEHLNSCQECQETYRFWKIAAQAVQENIPPSKSAPISILDRTMSQIEYQEEVPGFISRAKELIRSQIPLVNKEIWPSSLLVLLLGFVITLVTDVTGVFYAIAPLVSAGGLAFIYGKDNDPAYELVLSTPVSQVQILMARSVLVFGYNFLLVLMLSGSLLFFYPGNLIQPLMFQWLAPMTFLSTLSLGISVLFSSGNAITISCLLWLGRYIFSTPEVNQVLGEFGQMFSQFWQNPKPQFILSVVLLICIILFLQRISNKDQMFA